MLTREINWVEGFLIFKNLGYKNFEIQIKCFDNKRNNQILLQKSH